MCFAHLRATTACTFSTSQLPKVVRTWCVLTFSLRNVLRATTACTFSSSQLPKVVRAWCALYILTSKCASRHNGVHFFDISTSKSGSDLVCFDIFTSKCASRYNGVHFFDISTSKSGPTLVCLVHVDFDMYSRHNGVQLFISHLPRCLRTRRFSEPTFQPCGATKPRKNTVFRDFPTFSRTCIFFLLVFSLLTLLPAGCFFISPYCRKFDFQTSFENSTGRLRVDLE